VCDNCFSTTIYHPNSPLSRGFIEDEEDFAPTAVDDRVKIAIAADDSAKIQATIQGISIAMTGNPLGKEIDVRTIYLDSKLSESDTISGCRLQNSAETYKYARKIARDVYIEYEQSLGKSPDYGISFELGIERLDGFEYEAFFWIVMYNGNKFGSSRTQSMLLPTSVITNLEAHGMLKKEAENLLFGRPQAVVSKKKKNSSSLYIPIDSAGHRSPPSRDRASISRPPSDISSLTSPTAAAVVPAFSESVVCGVLLNMLHGRMTWAKYMEQSVVLATLPFEWNDMYSVIEL
jgi:non-canonical (house-cleaning) NTP pyrophosphatase